MGSQSDLKIMKEAAEFLEELSIPFELTVVSAHRTPQRMADSIGLVVERKRLPGEQDGLLWFCERCNNKLYEEFFALGSVETDFPPVFDRFYGSIEARTCKGCGQVNPAPARYG